MGLSELTASPHPPVIPQARYGSDLLSAWGLWGGTEESGGRPGPVLVPLFCLRYLDNIHLHPEEEKYQKIKLQNKVFQVRAVWNNLALCGQHGQASLVTQGPVVEPVERFLQGLHVKAGRGGFMYIGDT